MLGMAPVPFPQVTTGWQRPPCARSVGRNSVNATGAPPSGPTAGVGPDGGAPVAFTLFRPTDLAQGGLCHPVVTWGNGTGAMPSIYRSLLNQLASHGFVVIA